ncbi:MAG: hypothetical protein V4710_02565 [Verrucomicrobiota bacterium]
MSRVTPQARELAALLIAYEAAANKLSDADLPAVFHVCEKLRPHLAMLMGKAGFRAILSRALAVAAVEVPSLGRLRVTEEGSVEGWDPPEAQAGAGEEVKGGCALLVAQLIGLLVAFIGENLTLRLVRDVWPKLALENLNFAKGDRP